MKQRDDLGFAEAMKYETDDDQLKDTQKELIKACNLTLRECGEGGPEQPAAYILGVSAHCADPTDVRLLLHSSGCASDLLTIMDTVALDLCLSMVRDGIENTDTFTMVMSRMALILRYSQLPRDAVRKSIDEALGSRPDLYRRDKHGREHGDAQGQAGPSLKPTLN
jgi:hypothetical protein